MLTLDADASNSLSPNKEPQFISKFVKRVVARRFVDHAEHNLSPVGLPTTRVPSLPGSATVCAMNDIIRSIDDSKVDRWTRVLRLTPSTMASYWKYFNNRFSVNDISLSWFRPYLTDRTPSISVNGVQ